MIDTLLETIEEASNKIKEEQKKLADKVKDNLADAFKEVFDADPKLQSFRWEQYTPYFNDGNECVFNVHDYLTVIYGGEEYDDVDGWSVNEAISKNEDHYGTTVEVAKAVYPIIQLLQKVDDEIFKTIFGDHVQVTVTPNGIDVDEYYHD